MKMEANDYRRYLERLIKEYNASIEHWTKAKEENMDRNWADEFAEYCDGRIDVLIIVINQLKTLLEEEE
jgi:hypothetical protein